MLYALQKRAQEYNIEFVSLRSIYLDWVFQNRYFPDGLLPASFQAKDIAIGTTALLSGNGKWRSPLRISPPDDRLTSSYFGIYHPDVLHDFFLVLKTLDLKTILKQSERITSYSLPLPKRPQDNEEVRGVSDYLRLESDISSDAYDFDLLIKLDIKQCYPSIYSHSIHWAIDGYDNVRKEDHSNLKVTFNKNGPGHILDEHILSMNGGITKGLAVGPGASDIIAEILLRQIDREISKAFIDKGIFAYGGRYKDDYRLLLKDANDKISAIEIIEKHLRKYLLHLNDDKTSFDKPFELLQRDWMVEYHSILSTEEESRNQKHFLWHLAYVADLQRKYPGKRLLAKFLTNTKYRPKTKDDLHQITSVLLALSDIFRSAVPYSVSYIEKAAENIDTHEVNGYILNKLKCEGNVYNAVWYLYYLSNYLDNFETIVGDTAYGNFSDDFFGNHYFINLTRSFQIVF